MKLEILAFLTSITTTTDFHLSILHQQQDHVNCSLSASSTGALLEFVFGTLTDIADRNTRIQCKLFDFSLCRKCFASRSGR